VMLAPGLVMVGLGEASNMSGVESLKSALARIGSKREVVPLAFTHPGVIHLDTKFNIVAPNLGVISRDSFQERSFKWLAQHFELVDATPEETRAIQINTFAIGNGYVVMDARAERLAGILQRKGVKPILIDYSEVTSVPGSFRCCTCPLERSTN
jgi:N-dimethylarginine dimethylaminohydrolase